jgi:hypothetical protein
MDRADLSRGGGSHSCSRRTLLSHNLRLSPANSTAYTQYAELDLNKKTNPGLKIKGWIISGGI